MVVADKLSSRSCMVFSSESETNSHMTIAVLMFLGSVGSLYRCVANGVARSCAILNKMSHIIQILIPYLLGVFGIYCWNPHLPLKGSNCSSMQTAEPTKYIDLHKLMNMSLISRNAATSSPKRRSVLVALSSNLITDKRNRKRFFCHDYREN